MYQLVRDFHLKFGVPAMTQPALLDNQQQLYRLARMLEELHEFEQAHLKGDLVKAADALVDLVYFALGTADMMSLPFEEIFAMVHFANMSKRRVDGAGDSKYGDGNDIVKPEDWRSPHRNIENILRSYGYVPPQ